MACAESLTGCEPSQQTGTPTTQSVTDLSDRMFNIAHGSKPAISLGPPIGADVAWNELTPGPKGGHDPGGRSEIAFASCAGRWGSNAVTFVFQWTRSGPTLKRPSRCEACGQAFACELSWSGCWCSQVTLSAAAREEIGAKHTGCLCPACLKSFEEPRPTGAS